MLMSTEGSLSKNPRNSYSYSYSYSRPQPCRRCQVLVLVVYSAPITIEIVSSLPIANRHANNVRREVSLASSPAPIQSPQIPNPTA